MSYEQGIYRRNFGLRSNTRLTVMAAQGKSKSTKKIQDQACQRCMIRYEGPFGCLPVLLGKFENFQNDQGIHDLPEGLFGERAVQNTDA